MEGQLRMILKSLQGPGVVLPARSMAFVCEKSRIFNEVAANANAVRLLNNCMPEKMRAETDNVQVWMFELSVRATCLYMTLSRQWRSKCHHNSCLRINGMWLELQGWMNFRGASGPRNLLWPWKWIDSRAHWQMLCRIVIIEVRRYQCSSKFNLSRNTYSESRSSNNWTSKEHVILLGVKGYWIAETADVVAISRSQGAKYVTSE